MKAYRSKIAAGKSGAWRVERFTVAPEDEKFERLRAIVTGSGRFVPAGTYTRLMRMDEVIMTDTPDELRDIRPAVYQTKGAVLINGLGLGVALELMLLRPTVEQVTVIEKSADVIALVAPYFQETYPGCFEIICADAFTWQPPKNKRYNAVWHDIWDNINADNLSEMGKLHRKYGRRTDWQGSWCRERCELARQRDWYG